MQFQAGQDQNSLNAIDTVMSNFGKFFDSLQIEDIRSMNPDQLLEVLEGKIGGFDTETGSDDIKTKLSNLIDTSRKDTDDPSRGREALFALLKNLFIKRRQTVEGQIAQRKPIQLQLENLFRAQSAFEAIAQHSRNVEEDFQNIKNSAGDINNALSSAFKSQGSKSSRLFTAPAGAEKDNLSQVRGLDRLNQFERTRRQANLLSSPSVQQGRRNVFDENRNRVDPISRREANARIKDSRLNESRARKAEKEQTEAEKFSARKSQLEGTIAQVRAIQRQSQGKGFDRPLQNIEDALVGVQNKKATSFFDRSGKFNESTFSPLTNLSSLLKRELSKAGFSDISSKLSDDANESAFQQFQQAITKDKADKGLLTDSEIKSAVSAKVLTEKEGGELSAAANAQKFEPITSKLQEIANLISSIVGLMGGKSESSEASKLAAKQESGDKKAATPSPTPKSTPTPTSTPTTSATEEGLPERRSPDVAKSISQLVAEGKTITNEDLDRISRSDVQSGGTSGFRSFASDKRFAEANTAEKNVTLGRTAETDKIAVANLLKSATLPGLDKVKQTSLDDLFPTTDLTVSRGLEARTNQERGPSVSDLDKGSENLNQGAEILSALREAISGSLNTKDATNQQSQTKIEETRNHQKETAQASREQADIAQGTKSPSNEQGARQNRTTEISNVDAIGQTVKEGLESAAPAIGAAVSDSIADVELKVERPSGIGGETADLVSKVDAFIVENQSQTVALQDELELVKVNLVTVAQELNQTKEKVIEVEASADASKQPLAEVNQKADEASAKADTAATGLVEVRNAVEAVRGQVASLEGRVIFT
ncbi:MAG: hypothetical protein DRH08_10860 [Deltaproteobacteria bacterium]|nr:MAG: hypothetical protein DRH08_10860 [Deltaproteobacteria bacterium]